MTVMEMMQVAKLLAESELVPDHFKGKPADVFVAVEIADRAGLNAWGVMQNLYVIARKPAFETKLAIALLNGSGKIRGPVRFKKTEDGKGLTAYVVDASTGETIPHTLTWDTVCKNGWDKKEGWKKDAPLMMRYRVAMQLIRTTYPEVLLGMSTKEEVEEMVQDDPLTMDTAKFYDERREPSIEQEITDEFEQQAFDGFGDITDEEKQDIINKASS